jgi:uncharacterized protein (UPF0335 family)
MKLWGKDEPKLRILAEEAEAYVGKIESLEQEKSEVRESEASSKQS